MATYRAASCLLALALAITMMGKVITANIPPPKQDLLCRPDEVKGCSPCQNIPCSEIVEPSGRVCHTACIPTCVCPNNYYLQDGRCVPASKCRVQCAENMVFVPRAPEPATCADLYTKPQFPEVYKPRCVCKEGYVLPEKDSTTCIKIRECGKKPSTK
ncbi:uncharacterized protein PAF06_016672 [Gastrophryne carolinensis]